MTFEQEESVTLRVAKAIDKWVDEHNCLSSGDISRAVIDELRGELEMLEILIDESLKDK